MKVINTKFKGLKIISQKKNSDSRGNLREIYKKKIIKWDKLIFDYATTSKKNVLRGFHFQTKFEQAKYVNVLKGKIFDVNYNFSWKKNYNNPNQTKTKIEFTNPNINFENQITKVLNQNQFCIIL